MSTGRLNSPLYDERGQFIGNQQPEANMLSGFNPMGAIGTGVSSGAIPAVANPLDSVPAGGGKGGGKGGGFAPPPPPNMYGGVGYNTIMGAGGIRPTSTPAFTSGFTSPAMTPPQGKGGGKGGGMPPPAPAMTRGGKGGGKGGGMPSPRPDISQVSSAASSLGQALGGGGAGGPEGPPPPSNIADAAMGLTMNPVGGGKGGGKGGGIPDYMKEAAGRIGQPRTPPPSDMQAPPAGGGLFGGLANAANLLNQQRQRNDFISSDNELNRIRGAQMELERKARQEALNRSYYNQPAPQPTGASNLSDQEVIDYYTSRGEEVAMPSSPEFAQKRMDELRERMPADLSQPLAPVQPNLRTMPASRDPFVRRMRTQQDALNDAFRNRLNAMGSFRSPSVQESQRRFIEELRRGTPQETRLQRERRLISELADPMPGMSKAAEALRPLINTRGEQRLQPSLGAGLGAFGLSNFFGRR